MTVRIVGFVMSALLAVTGCASHEPAQERAAGTASLTQSSLVPAAFTNRVWVVAESDQVSRGSLRVFLSDGTLVMASPHATPAFGTWRYRHGHMTITEAGQTYKVDILALTGDTFRVRINSPGEPVVIRFVPATPPVRAGPAR